MEDALEEKAADDEGDGDGDASRACVEIEGAWLATAIVACPLLVARES